MSEPTKPDDVTAAAATRDEQPDASNWRAWLDCHGRKLLLFARQQTRSEHDAEDVFQDALVRLLTKVREGDFVGGQDAWMPFLYASIRRLAIDLGRREDRRKRREDAVGGDQREEFLDPVHPWFEGDAAGEETRKLLESGLKELPEKFSEVIVMKVWGEKTFAEIGEILGISQNTAASRYRYGLEGLRRKLGRARIKGDL